MTAIVLDSSVVIKWFLPEADSDIAERLESKLERGEIEILVPELFLAEIANILWKKRGELSEEEAERIIDSIISSGIFVIDIEAFLKEAHQIARQFNRSVYDSIYVALARLRDCDLVTADERLFNALAPHEPRVKLLHMYAVE